MVSNLHERINPSARQLNEYLHLSDLLPSLQSGFWPNNSTETAVLRISSDLLEAVDSGDVAALLVLIDLSVFCLRHYRSQYFVPTTGTVLWTTQGPVLA